MRMLISALGLAAALATMPAHAEPVRHQFEHDGVTYTYTETVHGDRRILRGHASPGGRFRLVVENGWVRGTAGLTPVRFSVAEAYERVRSDAMLVASTED